MRRPDIPPVAITSADDCEQQFYEAMQAGDIERLMALWADDDEVACIHPGSPRLVGLQAIRTSFAGMFRAGGIDVRVDRVRRHQMGQTAVHHVVERVQAMGSDGPRIALVVVTNVYVQGAFGWRIAVHHASPQPARSAGVEGASMSRLATSDDPDDDTPTTLH